MLAYPVGPDRNRARCRACGWHGVAAEMRPEPTLDGLAVITRSLASRIAALEAGRQGPHRLRVSCEGCGMWLDWPVRTGEPGSKFVCNCDPPRQRVEFHRDGDGLLLAVEPWRE